MTLKGLLDDIEECDQCSFADHRYPALAPVRLADKTKVMFIGENPSWEFGQRVPFDGITKSGRALHDNYVVPLKRAYALKESDFWITDLFKCRYPKGIYHSKNAHKALILRNAAACATTWLVNEIRLTRPMVIITVGDKEVYQRLRAIFNLSSPLLFKDAAYKLQLVEIAGHQCKLLPACHPDISFENPRKPIPSQRWSQMHKSRFVSSLEETLK